MVPGVVVIVVVVVDDDEDVAAPPPPVSVVPVTCDDAVTVGAGDVVMSTLAGV